VEATAETLLRTDHLIELTPRIGFGFDVHPLKAGVPFYMGGVLLEHHSGTVGHSDADVLIHAICDALLGAAALGDIGQHFPNTDPRYKNIDSKKLLVSVMELIKKEGYRVGNIDSTICLEAPKINPHIPAMKKVLAPILGISEGNISVKATTNERLGFIGREEGVSANAVVVLFQK